MTAATAALCGRRWPGGVHADEHGLPRLHHLCELPDGHHLDGPIRRPCACRCGATTTRKDT